MCSPFLRSTNRRFSTRFSRSLLCLQDGMACSLELVRYLTSPPRRLREKVSTRNSKRRHTFSCPKSWSEAFHYPVYFPDCFCRVELLSCCLNSLLPCQELDCMGAHGFC